MKFLSYLLLLTFTLPSILNAQAVYTQYDHNTYRQFDGFNQTIAIENFSAETLNACVFFATNEIRAKKRLPLLSYHALLEQTAMLHSKDMVELDFFDHNNRKIKEHRTPNDRATVVDIETPYLAENIIEGFILEYEAGYEVYPKTSGIFVDLKTQDTLQARTYLELTNSMLSLWMKSDGHRKNILSKDALQLGCGSAVYIMRDFNDMPIVRATQCFQWFEVIPE